MALHAASFLDAAGLAGLLAATVTDIRSRIIPNGLVLWVIGAGCLARLAANGPDAWLSLAIALAVFLLLAIAAYRGLIGGGDAKMIPAAALLVPPAHVVDLLLAVAVAGGVLAAAYLLAGLWSRVAAPVSSRLASVRTELPYGAAIFAGAAFTLLRLA